MHYSSRAFAIDRSKPTIIALNKEKAKNMGHAEGKLEDLL
jgi:hypothetical protein